MEEITLVNTRYDIGGGVNRIVIRPEGRIVEGVEQATKLLRGKVGRILLLADKSNPETSAVKSSCSIQAGACRPIHGHSMDDLQPRDFFLQRSCTAPVLAATAWELVKIIDAAALIAIQSCLLLKGVFRCVSLVIQITILRSCLQSASILTSGYNTLEQATKEGTDAPLSGLVQLSIRVDYKTRDAAAIHTGATNVLGVQKDSF